MATSILTSDYDRFAWIYSQHWGKEFSERVQPVLEELVLRHLPHPARILDLCCGAGHVAEMLVRRGFRVTGIDASAEMVRHARRNAPGAEFMVADARSFESATRFDAALCTFNSLAHLPSREDLTRALSNVRAVLKPGAWFLFDLSTEQAYRTHWRGEFGVVGPDHACIVRPSYDPQTRLGHNHITVLRRGEPSDRINLAITQHCYSEWELRDALAHAKFSDLQTFDAERDLRISGDSGRMFFLSTRP